MWQKSLQIALACLAAAGAGALVHGEAAPEPQAPAAAAPAAPPAAADAAAPGWRPAVPKTWDDAALATFEVPLVAPAPPPKHFSAEFYYQMPRRIILRSYPVYHPDREPPGYLKWLESQAPEVAFDASQLHSREDWVRAGELVFEAPIVFNGLNQVADVRDREWYRETGVPVAKDGTVPFFRYVVIDKGKVALAEFSCAACHTRVLADGTVVRGAQGNYPLSRLDARAQRREAAAAPDPRLVLERFLGGVKAPYGAPWLGDHDPAARYGKLSLEQIIAGEEAIPAGVQARFGTSDFNPVQVPDLIGLEARRYFDRTGNMRHRDAGDLMRYAALNQGLAFFDRYGDFIPAGRLPEPAQMVRYSDEQLYALALYLYSLRPPENLHRPDARSARGKEIFARERCGGCHAPPLYTNNKLVPVDGFTPPADHPEQADIMAWASVGTDPGLALYTRRGTGMYKVPSLLGLWYRGPLEHSGSVATLEDWFDPRRRRDDYVPTGFRGAGVKTRAVPGHPFGLNLEPEERAALIAFLRTL